MICQLLFFSKNAEGFSHLILGHNFFEHDIDEIDTLVEIVNHKYQTLTYFGIEENSLRQFVVNNRLLGIDRVVPVGRALDMEIVWDGYDIVRTLSRVIGR